MALTRAMAVASRAAVAPVRGCINVAVARVAGGACGAGASLRWSSTDATPAPGPTTASSATVVPAAGYPPQPADEKPVDVTFGEVSTASYRIRSGIARTLMHRSRKMSNLLGSHVYFKNEFQHPTGSFKERGGRNALLLLGEWWWW
jgi:hypothetical protein